MHTYISKDDPSKPRSQVGGNYAAAVSAATKETARQWRDFSAQLSVIWPGARGKEMACVLTHDNPGTDCVKVDFTYTGTMTATHSCQGTSDVCSGPPGASISESGTASANLDGAAELPSWTTQNQSGTMTPTSASYYDETRWTHGGAGVNTSPGSDPACEAVLARNGNHDDGISKYYSTSATPGTIKVDSLEPVKDATGKVTDLRLVLSLFPTDGTYEDLGSSSEKITGPPPCAGGWKDAVPPNVPGAVTWEFVDNANAALKTYYPLEKRFPILVTGWTLTSTPDGLLKATKSYTFSGPEPGGVGTVQASVTETLTLTGKPPK